MLDLGAAFCTSRSPRCGGCPVAAACAWHAAGCPAPDPAYRSGGTSSPQSTFAGSDRQGRGRLVAALRRGPVAMEEVAVAAGWPDDAERAYRAAGGLVEDGLATVVTDAQGGTWLALPA
jgi:A/G-specific adenine glycosylase